MDIEESAWKPYVAQTVVVFAVLLGFQYFVRGELNVPVAIIAALGYFAVSVALEQYRRGD